MEAFWNALISMGPPAVVLGFMLKVLWAKFNKQRSFYEGDPGDEKIPPTIGRLQTESNAARVREDAIRAEYDKRLEGQRKHYEGLIAQGRDDLEAELKTERDENKALQREINETLKELLSNLNKPERTGDSA